MGRSERTIYRWLSELSNEIGARVYFKDGGYHLTDDIDSPAPFTPEELLVLRAALKSQVFSDESPLRDKAESAWLKIRDASPYERMRIASELSESYCVQPTVPKGFVDPNMSRVIESAIATHRRLRIVYWSQKSNQIKDYTIDPYALVFRRHSWYLLAHCFEHGEVAQFKLVRMREVAETGVKFEPPADFSVEEYFRHSWEAWAGGTPIDVRVKFSPRVSVMVAESRRHPSQKVYPQPDGSVIFEATVAGVEEIAIWILGFGRDAEVLDPPELRNYIVDHVFALVDLYSHRDSDDRDASELTGACHTH